MNKDILSKLLVFATGAAIGSITTYILMKKYSQVEYEEYYETDESEEPEESEVQEETEEPKTERKKNIVNYNKIIKKAGYSYDDEPADEKEELDVDKPYLISVDDYAELDGYSVNSLYYYEDGVLTDENDNVIDDVDEIVGIDSLAEFENEAIDSVYVRNDALRSDYEILRDKSRYCDSHPMEEE